MPTSLSVIYCVFPKQNQMYFLVIKHAFFSISYISFYFFFSLFVGMFLYFLTCYCCQMLIIRSVGWHYRPLQVTPPNYDLLHSTTAGQETPQGIFKSAQLDNVVLNITVSPLGVFSICSGHFD